MDLRTKAYLISVGTIDVAEPRGSGPSSTSGPGAGGNSIFFCSGDRMVRLSIVPGSPLRLARRGDEAVILSGDSEVARGSLIEPLSHCPEQAYITVSERCIFDCKFCAVPKMMGEPKSFLKVAGIVQAAADTGKLKAISLTSGVEVSPEAEVDRVALMVRGLRRFGVPIGVSVCPTRDSNRILKDAGALEIKYNVETMDPDLFSRVCPGMDLEAIKAALADGVSTFGRNRVFTNVIAGLGESDRAMREGIDELAEMGVLPVIRAVFPHPLRAGEMEMKRPSAKRLLMLAEHTQRALDRCGLRGDKAETMCYCCTGCDLTPHRDF